MVYETYFPDKQITVIPNFSPSSDHLGSQARSGWLYVGRLVPDKGVAWLLENWPQGLRLTLVGDGPLAPMALAAEAARPDEISYRGNVNRADVLTLMTTSAGLIVPSLWAEGFPTVVLEALSTATPIIISTRCSAATQLQTDGAAVLLDANNGQAGLIQACSDVMGNPSLGSAGRALHGRKFSEAAWARTMTATLEEVAGRS